MLQCVRKGDIFLFLTVCIYLSTYLLILYEVCVHACAFP